VLKKKHSPLCKISQQITDKLFVDEIKACDYMTALGKYHNKFEGDVKFGRRDSYRDFSCNGNFHGNAGYDQMTIDISLSFREEDIEIGVFLDRIIGNLVLSSSTFLRPQMTNSYFRNK
jgi:hypothetical protein